MKVKSRTADREVSATVAVEDGQNDLTVRIWKGALILYQGGDCVTVPRPAVDAVLKLVGELVSEARA